MMMTDPSGMMRSLVRCTWMKGKKTSNTHEITFSLDVIAERAVLCSSSWVSEYK